MEQRLIKPIALFLLVLLIIIGLIFSGNKRIEPISEMRILMDTMITIKAYGDPRVAKTAIERGFAAFSRIEKIASFHITNSELSNLNLNGKITAGPEMYAILNATSEFFQRTMGYFDPTFAGLQRAYGFYDKTGRLPEQSEIEETLTHTGWQANVKFENEKSEVTLASDSLIDLGGIAGGYAIEQAATEMKKLGCTAFLIDDAGDIWFEGKKPDGSPWKIAVRDPRDNSSLAIFESSEPVAISTSGNYERFVTVNGKNYGHIMDPHTGRPADYYQSVTVIGRTPIEADVFSTAFYAMPPEEGFKWAETNSIPVLCLTSDNQVKLNRAGEKWFKLLKN